MMNVADLAPERLRPLLRSEYDQLVASGAFEDERVELLDGMLVTMSPQDPAHASTVQRLAHLLFAALRDRAIVRPQLPLALLDDSEPEPDVAVVPLGDYSHVHPSRADLVIEVAVSSVRLDRVLKGRIYARAGVIEYWLVDVNARSVTVHRGPQHDTFTDVTRHGEAETLLPVAFPDVQVRIAEILPTAR